MIEQVDPETGTEGLMQVDGVGSGHDTYSHQVTGCIHEHGENKDVGGAGTKMRKRTDYTDRRGSIAGEFFGESYVLGAEYQQ